MSHRLPVLRRSGRSRSSHASRHHLRFLLLWPLLLVAGTACEPVAEEGLPVPADGPDVMEVTIPELQAGLAAGDFTSVELVDAYLARIEAYDRDGPELNAILRINPAARTEADALDRERVRGNVRGPLHGIPIILKDNYDTADLPTTGACVGLAGSVPPDDAFQVRKLREAGAIVLAKSNMHELAAGITTVSSLGGQTRNPYDPRRNPGGSSGGTGAAVAASFGAIGWGTDTCGSIRIPSAFNNLFGLRPTKGLSSIDGIIPLSHTQDVGGPLARHVVDLAIGLDATVGPDPADPATEALRGRSLPRFRDSLDAEALQGARLGVVWNLFGDPPDDQEVDSLLRLTVAELVEAGADTVGVEIPRLDELMWPSSVISHEFKFDLQEYLRAPADVPVGSLDEILELGLHHAALEGTFRRRNEPESMDSKDYRDALARREELAAILLKVMNEGELDALIYPTIRRRPAIIGEQQGGSTCQLSAGSGFPALALPGAFTRDGLPTGLEVLGRPFHDARLVAMAFAYEQVATPRRPPPSTPALEGGEPPGVVNFRATIPVEGDTIREMVEADFGFDPVMGTLAFSIRVSGVPPEEVHAVTLNRAEEELAGPVMRRLLGPGTDRGSDDLALGNRERQDLLNGDLLLVLYSARHPTGTLRTALRVPR